jgi:hypothetical protein
MVTFGALQLGCSSNFERRHEKQFCLLYVFKIVHDLGQKCFEHKMRGLSFLQLLFEFSCAPINIWRITLDMHAETRVGLHVKL